ncbi:hypothetical protein D3C78_1374150 [compost metagenome]
MHTPLRRSSSRMRNNCSVSCEVSTAVGSSNTSTEALRDSALAISTACWWATGNAPTARRSSMMAKPNSSRMRRALARSVAHCTRPLRAPRSSMQMFSATDRCGARANSW